MTHTVYTVYCRRVDTKARTMNFSKGFETTQLQLQLNSKPTYSV